MTNKIRDERAAAQQVVMDLFPSISEYLNILYKYLIYSKYLFICLVYYECILYLFDKFI